MPLRHTDVRGFVWKSLGGTLTVALLAAHCAQAPE
jgi:hypothetical protein